MVLRLLGEIDTLTYQPLLAAVSAALFGSVDQPTRHLIIDLAGVNFCAARGMVLLADTATEAARADIRYALAACPSPLQRQWRLLFPNNTAARRYPSTAAAVIASYAPLAAS